MPLPPLPDSNTARGLILYTCGGITHDLQIRLGGDATLTEMETYANGIIADMAPLMDPSDQVTGGIYIPEGTNVGQPMLVDTPAGSGTDLPSNDINNSGFFSVTGKSVDGRRVRVTLFTLFAATFADTRIGIGVAAPALVNWFESVRFQGDVKSVTKSGAFPNWNSYFNIGRNSYWQRKQR